MRIGFLGSEGSFHSKAVRPLLSDLRAEAFPMPTVRGLVAAVEQGVVECGLLAVETNLCGLIGPHLRSILAGDVQVCDEVVYEARMALIGSRDLDLASVEAVYSHPEALAECDAWLSENLPNAALVPTDSSSAGVDRARLNPTNSAAIAGPDTASAAGLAVLADDIADPPGDITRFWLLTKQPLTAAPLSNRTILVITPQARDLSAVHTRVAKSGLTISRMDCVTARGDLGEYRLLVELAQGISTSEVEELLDDLGDIAANVRVLGSYRSSSTPESKQSQPA